MIPIYRAVNFSQVEFYPNLKQSVNLILKYMSKSFQLDYSVFLAKDFKKKKMLTGISRVPLKESNKNLKFNLERLWSYY